MPDPPILPDAVLRAVERGWTGVTLVEDPEAPPGGRVTLLHVGDHPRLEDAHLGLAGGGPAGADGAGHILSLWVCDGTGTRCGGARCALDLAYAGGRRLVRRIVDEGALDVCAGRPGCPASIRRATLRVSPAMRGCLEDVLALAEEWHVADPPTFGIRRPEWRRLVDSGPALVAARGTREDVVLAVPAAALAAGDDPIGSLSFRLATIGGAPHLETRLWRGGVETTILVSLEDPAQRELALRIPFQNELYLVGVEPRTGSVADMIRAVLSLAEPVSPDRSGPRGGRPAPPGASPEGAPRG